MTDRIKHISAATTMLGPAGISHSSDPNNPPQTEISPMIDENKAICSGELDSRRAVAAGIINNAVISNTPTIFMEMAITPAIMIMKIKLV
jgi:hypothetical protein